MYDFHCDNRYYGTVKIFIVEPKAKMLVEFILKKKGTIKPNTLSGNEKSGI